MPVSLHFPVGLVLHRLPWGYILTPETPDFAASSIIAGVTEGWSYTTH